MTTFSDFIIYFDESGSPSLEADRDDFPVFVLACICVDKTVFAERVVPKLQLLKFRYFGHDQVILHERDIRRQSGAFSVFRADRVRREAFLADVSSLIEELDFRISAAVIDKAKLAARYPSPISPYEISLLLTMEHLALHCGTRISLERKFMLLLSPEERLRMQSLSSLFAGLLPVNRRCDQIRRG